MKIYIIIPTYNEKDNIEKLIELIFGLNIPHLFVLVVDDNSPDKTGNIVEGLKSQYNNLDILHRKKKSGIGPAYIAGFRWVLQKGADLIFEMDADLSHNPKHIPEFLQNIEQYDVVLGSRHVPGGGIENWSMFRKLISRFGNIYARTILSLPFQDITGGFKCYRRKVLEDIDLDSLSSVGYNFQIETTYVAYRRGFRIKEIPIIFTDRILGKSKFDKKIIFEAFWKVLLLRFQKK